MKRIIVTGALGHIGSRLIREIPAAFPGAQIVMVDDLSSQRYCSLFDLPASARYEFVEGDVVTADLSAIVAGADAVVHLAAITDAQGSTHNPAAVERVNRAGTEQVARACVRAGSPMLFVSTSSVYSPRSAVVDEDCPIEDLTPQSPYAESKLRAERFLERMAVEEGLRFVTCRFATIFGPSVGMRFHTAISRFCLQASTGQPLTIWRTAMHQMRPYLELGDAVRAVTFMIQRELYDGRPYNVLTTNASVKDIYDIILRHESGTVVKYVDSEIMNQLSYRVSDERLRSAGFRPDGSLETGIGETLRLLSGLSPRHT